MRLFDAIIDANNRALAGDTKAGVHVGDFADHLPVVALTCIDPRLNRFFPGILGLPDTQFIWLRNAGNVLCNPANSTIRSIALACAIKGGREVAIIGHTDCLVGKTTVQQLTELLKNLGIPRHQLPENLVEYFGLFASERQNVITGVDFARQSPLIGPKIPVHGLLVDTESGKLQWVVNGYEALERPGARAGAIPPASAAGDAIGKWAGHALEEVEGLAFPRTQIGEVTAKIGQLLSTSGIIDSAPEMPQPSPAPITVQPIPASPRPPATISRPIPVPPPIQPMPRARRK